MADTDIIREAREFLTRAESNESENRDTYRKDVKFARLRQQWPEGVKARREAEGRPCLTVDKIGPVIRQVVNDARQNRPAIKVLPQDSRADPETAEVMTGLIRNIEQASNADVAYDTAIDNAVSGGFGYWRINLEYANDVSLEDVGNLGPEAFEQDIRIKRVMDPLSVYGDPDSVAADSSDWMNAIVLDKMTEAKFKRKYPKAKRSGFDSAEWSHVDSTWKTDKEITVAEYWVREEVTAQVISVQLVDGIGPDGQPVIGDVVTMLVDEWEEKQAEGVMGQPISPPRPVKSYKVTQYIVTGLEVLETNDWPGTYIPIVPVYGDEVVIEGTRFFLSLTSAARGAQEQFNFWLTTATEMAGLAPRMPFIGPRGAFKDKRWQTINSVSHPFVEYDGPVKPERQPLPQLPASDLQMAATASDNIKATTGLFDASLGARSNETSGRAIIARQREGDTSTFHFIDNLSRAIRHTGKLLLDLIPKVYSTARVVRILGEDGKPENRQVNQQYAAGQDPQTGAAIIKMHDFKAGRYDLAVSTGPSFTTKREEAASQMIELIRAYPAAAPLIGDLLVSNLDLRGADEIAQRFKSFMQAQMGGQQGQQQPDPADMAKMQVEGGKLQVQQFEAETDRMRAQAEMQAAMTPQQVQQIVVQTMRQMLPGIAA